MDLEEQRECGIGPHQQQNWPVCLLTPTIPTPQAPQDLRQPLSACWDEVSLVLPRHWSSEDQSHWGLRERAYDCKTKGCERGKNSPSSFFPKNPQILSARFSGVFSSSGRCFTSSGLIILKIACTKERGNYQKEQQGPGIPLPALSVAEAKMQMPRPRAAPRGRGVGSGHFFLRSPEETGNGVEG